MSPAGIDLRSDTVTKPTPEMRRAMAEAEVGDDVLDGDPTTRRLEQRTAELLGMDDALFFPSGTQANQTGIALCTRPGTELVVEANAHLVTYEMAGVAALSGVQIRPVVTPDGLLTARLVQGALRTAPRQSAVAVENSHNASGGRVLPPAEMAAIVAVAGAAGLKLHLDGARLWNAATALQVSPAQLVLGVTTVMVSYSKGLGCPVGSCLAFASRHRAEAWEIRKRLGGGMRQSGVLAAAGLYALEHHLPGIAKDHEHARLLAERLADCRAVRVEMPETNIVMIDLVRDEDTADAVIPRLGAAGLHVASYGTKRMRAAVHRDVGRAEMERAAALVRQVLQ
ncbi:MAG: threonine aldolase family protein [Gemmatimonadales bacterium]